MVYVTKLIALVFADNVFRGKLSDAVVQDKLQFCGKLDEMTMEMGLGDKFLCQCVQEYLYKFGQMTVKTVSKSVQLQSSVSENAVEFCSFKVYVRSTFAVTFQWEHSVKVRAIHRCCQCGCSDVSVITQWFFFLNRLRWMVIACIMQY